MILLDPLPEIRDRMTGSPTALEILGFYKTPTPIVMSKRLTEGVQSTQPLEFSTSKHGSRKIPNESIFLGVIRRYIVREPRRRTDNKATDESRTFSVTDPEDGRPYRQNTGISRKSTANVKPQGRLAGILARIARSTVQSPSNQRPDETAAFDDEVEKTSESITIDPVTRCMFEHLGSRGPPVDYGFLMSIDGLDSLAEHIRGTKCTAENVSQWLQRKEDPPEVSKRDMVYPLTCLFAIAEQDTSDVLGLMSSALSDFSHDILDDTLIQGRLIHWRHLLERFDTELTRMEDNFRPFASFVSIFGDLNHDRTDNRSSVEAKLDRTLTHISRLRKRTRQSYQSLMANMSIFESKRGIAEAESVTKLTELAFFFIPLTFSASIFSMQVKELGQPNVSLSNFFTVAIVITVCSYALRLVLRSTIFISLRRKIQQNVRSHANIAPGTPIPTMSFLEWVWDRIGLVTVISTILVVLLTVPIIVLWTRSLNSGFKALLTVLLLLVILIASTYTATALVDIDQGGIHLRRKIFEPAKDVRPQTRKHSDAFATSLASFFSSRLFGIILASVIVGAGPLAALWTRPLQTGIKVGATVAICTLYIIGLAFALLYGVQISTGGLFARRSIEERIEERIEVS